MRFQKTMFLFLFASASAFACDVTFDFSVRGWSAKGDRVLIEVSDETQAGTLEEIAIPSGKQMRKHDLGASGNRVAFIEKNCPEEDIYSAKGKCEADFQKQVQSALQPAFKKLTASFPVAPTEAAKEETGKTGERRFRAAGISETLILSPSEKDPAIAIPSLDLFSEPVKSAGNLKLIKRKVLRGAAFVGDQKAVRAMYVSPDKRYVLILPSGCENKLGIAVLK